VRRPILLVEDSERDAMAMKELLRSIGVKNQIVPLNSGRKALSYLLGDGDFTDKERYPVPGIVLLDLRMPDLDGFDVLEWMNQRPEFKQVLIVVLSAYDGLREVKHAYSLGAKSFLVKPCSAADIRNMIEAYPQHWTLSPDFKFRTNFALGLPNQPPQ
jgi:CheY-like chemotaxis protein